MGIAHHANYIVWFEVGRTDLCREIGFPYPDIEARGFILVVTEIGVKYRVPFAYDDEVVIRTSIADVASRAIRYVYELCDASGAVRATGFSSHMWVDRATRKPVRAPEDVVRAFQRFALIDG